MTLYDALKKADEVRHPFDCRLSPGATTPLGDIVDDAVLASDVADSYKPLPRELKNFRITTTSPKNLNNILAIFKRVEQKVFDDMCDYRIVSRTRPTLSTLSLCTRGLIYVFGKVPEKLYISKTETSK